MGNVSVTDPDCQESRPGALFSDRLWALKLGGALALFGYLCHRSATEISELQPDIEAGAIQSDRLRGLTIRAWAYKVLAITGDGFDIQTSVGPFHVTSSTPPPRVGGYVSILGEFVEPRHLVARRVQDNPGYLWKRGLNYGLSSLTVVVFLWMVRRRFRWRPWEGMFRSRY